MRKRSPRHLGRLAFDAWEHGRLDDAIRLYRRAIPQLDRAHWATSMIFGEYAGVLSAAGWTEAADIQYSRALEIEVEEDPEQAEAGVAAARYLFAEHLLKSGRAEQALAVVDTLIQSRHRDVALAHTIRAVALQRLGREVEANDAAGEALRSAKSEKQRQNVETRLTRERR